MSRTATEPIPLRRKPELDRLDVSIVLTASALLIIGLVMNLSASSVRSAQTTGSAFTFFLRQFMWAALGFAALLVTSRIDYRRLRGWSYFAVPVVWVLLLMIPLTTAGAEAYGATRWLQIGPLSLQPSEAAKLVLIVAGADVLSRKLGKLHEWRHLVVPFFGAVGITAILVLLQPDFGTTVILVASCGLLAFLAGAPARFLGVGLLGGLVVGLPVMIAEPYRRARLFGFFNADSDALNTGYQTMQGLYALGDGGLFGVGLGASRQKYLYLPNAHTDFIFAILGEETGLAGALTVLVLFAVIAVLGVRAARRAVDPFGFLLAAGIVGWISLQVLINIATVARLLPITGVPLPLISFGGTSLVFSLAGLGLVASVARHGARPAPRT